MFVFIDYTKPSFKDYELMVCDEVSLIITNVPHCGGMLRKVQVVHVLGK